jgi:hypothetical protein|tara:strand:+ start:9453 stop:9590 length:138 start_codon:yes stop_codon:yes gene_type:complete
MEQWIIDAFGWIVKIILGISFIIAIWAGAKKNRVVNDDATEEDNW